MKTCSNCNQEKSLIEFYKREKEKDGFNPQCKICVKSYELEYRSDNRNRIREISNKHYNTHKEKYKENRKNNIDKISQYNKKYNSIEKNKAKRRISRKKEYDLKYGVDMQYTLSLSIRNRLKAALKSKSKSNSTFHLLGCTIWDYVIYLEKQFDGNMNWDNYGDYWQIDHIQQLFTFDLKIEGEQEKAFNYKNTRPLSVTDNQKRPKS